MITTTSITVSVRSIHHTDSIAYVVESGEHVMPVLRNDFLKCACIVAKRIAKKAGLRLVHADKKPVFERTYAGFVFLTTAK
jgi:hypothetical protein